MRLRRLAFAAALVVVAGLGFLAATLVVGGDEEVAPRPAVRERANGRATAQAPPVAPVRASDRVRALARSLGAEARVAQLFLVGFEGTDGAAPIFASLGERAWGSVVIGPRNVPLPEYLGALAGQIAVAPVEPSPLVVVDDLPTLPAPPAGRSPAEARTSARSAAQSLRASGVHAVLAPQADLAVPAGPAAETGFADRERAVARLALAAVRGWLEGGVLPAVGHFPGQGAASQDPVEGPSIVGAEPEVAAFAPALRRSPAVVVSNAAYARYDSVTPAVLLPEVVRDLLRGELRFGGVAIADDLVGTTVATGASVGRAATDAIKAGIDVVQIRDPTEADVAFRAVLRAARSGEIPAARLREALLRVLVLKERAGLL